MKCCASCPKPCTDDCFKSWTPESYEAYRTFRPSSERQRLKALAARLRKRGSNIEPSTA
jgi:hypothetical protein